MIKLKVIYFYGAFNRDTININLADKEELLNEIQGRIEAPNHDALAKIEIIFLED